MGRSFDLKELTTSRIRSVLLGMPSDDKAQARAPGSLANGWMFNNYPLTEKEMFVRKTLLAKAGTHFLAHYHDACEAIQSIFGYDLRAERKDHLL